MTLSDGEGRQEGGAECCVHRAPSTLAKRPIRSPSNELASVNRRSRTLHSALSPAAFRSEMTVSPGQSDCLAEVMVARGTLPVASVHRASDRIRAGRRFDRPESLKGKSTM